MGCPRLISENDRPVPPVLHREAEEMCSRAGSPGSPIICFVLKPWRHDVVSHVLKAVQLNPSASPAMVAQAKGMMRLILAGASG